MSQIISRYSVGEDNGGSRSKPPHGQVVKVSGYLIPDGAENGSHLYIGDDLFEVIRKPSILGEEDWLLVSDRRDKLIPGWVDTKTILESVDLPDGFLGGMVNG